MRRHRHREEGGEAVKNTNSTQDREISLAEQAAAEAAQHFSNLQSIIIDLDQTITDLSDVISGLTEEKIKYEISKKYGSQAWDEIQSIKARKKWEERQDKYSILRMLIQ